MLLDRAFTLANDELTATLKYRRQIIFARYQQAIETLYAQAGTKEDV